MSAPLIETERLVLRGHGLDDLDRFAEIWADDRVAGPIGLPAQARDKSLGRLLRYAGHWALRDFGTWAIEEKSSHRIIGEVGLFDYERDLPAAYAGKPEHGWALAPEAQGKGYALEALRASLAWGTRRFSPFEPFCIVSVGNAPSLKLAAKAGYQEASRTLFKGKPTVFLVQGGALPEGAGQGDA